MALPGDEALTNETLTVQNTGTVLLVACGALAREILDLKAANGWSHLALTCRRKPPLLQQDICGLC
jgi:hypothetical protein